MTRRRPRRRPPRSRPPQQREPATTIYERSVEGRRAATLPPAGRPRAAALDELIPRSCLRAEGPGLPEVSEPEIVRHYNRLSRRNFDLDTGPYPLGSCTMKHNPRLNEKVAALPGHARLHPAQDPKRAQGALELMWRLERALSEICGLPHVIAAALGRLARRARRAAPDPRLPRRTAASSGPRCSPPTPRTAPTRRR